MSVTGATAKSQTETINTQNAEAENKANAFQASATAAAEQNANENITTVTTVDDPNYPPIELGNGYRLEVKDYGREGKFYRLVVPAGGSFDYGTELAQKAGYPVYAKAFSDGNRVVLNLDDAVAAQSTPAPVQRHSSGYPENPNYNITNNKYWVEYNNRGAQYRHYQSNPEGFKFHVSIDPQDVNRASELLIPIFQKYGVPAFKFAPQNDLAKYGNENYVQKGKVCTVYYDGVSNWNAMAQEIESALKSNGIKPGAEVLNENKVRGSSYLSGRGDRWPMLAPNPDGNGYRTVWGYVANTDIEAMDKQNINSLKECFINGYPHPDDVKQGIMVPMASGNITYRKDGPNHVDADEVKYTYLTTDQYRQYINSMDPQMQRRFLNGQDASNPFRGVTVQSPPLSSPQSMDKPSAQAIAQTRQFNERHVLDFNDQVQPGYRDGGRSVQFNDQGQPVTPTNREIIVVKPAGQDPAFDNLVAKAKAETSGMSASDKAVYLNRLVDQTMPIYHEDANWRVMQDAVGGQLEGKEISLGRLIELRTGVCRHRSLLYKALGDKIGLSSQLVRGNWYAGPGDGGGHAWNVIQQDNGRPMIVDVMHQKTYRQHADGTWDAGAERYTDVNNNKLYVNDNRAPVAANNNRYSNMSAEQIVADANANRRIQQTGSNKGYTYMISGSAEELATMQSKFSQAGIETVIEKPGSDFGAGLRVKTASVAAFELLYSGSGRNTVVINRAPTNTNSLPSAQEMLLNKIKASPQAAGLLDNMPSGQYRGIQSLPHNNTMVLHVNIGFPQDEIAKAIGVSSDKLHPIGRRGNFIQYEISQDDIRPTISHEFRGEKPAVTETSEVVSRALERNGLSGADVREVNGNTAVYAQNSTTKEQVAAALDVSVDQVESKDIGNGKTQFTVSGEVGQNVAQNQIAFEAEQARIEAEKVAAAEAARVKREQLAIREQERWAAAQRQREAGNQNGADDGRSVADDGANGTNRNLNTGSGKARGIMEADKKAMMGGNITNMALVFIEMIQAEMRGDKTLAQQKAVELGRQGMTTGGIMAVSRAVVSKFPKLAGGPVGAGATVIAGAPNVYNAFKDNAGKGLVELTVTGVDAVLSFVPGGGLLGEGGRAFARWILPDELDPAPSLYEVLYENISAVVNNRAPDPKQTDRVLRGGH